MRQTEVLKLQKQNSLLFRPQAVTQLRKASVANGENYVQGQDFHLDPKSGYLEWTGAEAELGADVIVVYER